MQMAACARQTFLSKTFTNSLNMQKQYEKNVWETSNDTYSLSVRVQTTINHISICFLPQYQRQRKRFSSERELKKALRDTLTRAAWYCEISSKKDFCSSSVSILCSCLNIVIFISSVHISMLSGKPPERNKFPRNVFKFAGLARN